MKFNDRKASRSTILVIQRGYMLEHPRILYAERYEVGTISREDPKGNPQRLHAALRTCCGDDIVRSLQRCRVTEIRLSDKKLTLPNVGTGMCA